MMIINCCNIHNNIFLDLKNIIIHQSLEIIKLQNDLYELQIKYNKNFFKQYVLQEIKFYYELNKKKKEHKKNKEYKELSKQILIKKIKNIEENNDSYIFI